MSLAKKKPFRSDDYRAWVRTLPSALGGKYTAPWLDSLRRNDPHHIKGRGYGGSLKCSDWLCIPLTHEQHDDLHSRGWKSWEIATGCDQRKAVIKTLEYARKVGVIVDSPEADDYLLNEYMDRLHEAAQEGLDIQLSVIADGFNCGHWIVDEERAGELVKAFKARKL